MRGEGQRLTEHLKAILTEIERLKVVYCDAIEQLETNTLQNLSPQSATQWFKMYLRVVDLGIQLRRGEIRHRSTQQFTFPRMHETGTKGAVHSGLSIDDGNAIYQLMESRRLVSESRLDYWFIRMDGLDRDDISLLDKRVTGCLESFRRQDSNFYHRLDVTGEDPHEELVVLGELDGTSSRVLAKATRTCFGPSKCSCEEDARPWEGFSLTSGDPLSQNFSLANASSSTMLVELDEIGIIDIKRQMGFEQLSCEEAQEDAVALARDSSRLARRLNSSGNGTAASVGLHNLPSARSLYQKRCVDIGQEAKPSITAVLAVKKGAHYLDLSGIGFHSARDLQDLVDIFATSGLPPVKELDVSNGFFNAAAFEVLCKLLRLPLLRQNVERLSFRGIAAPRPADIAALMRLLTGDSTSVGSLSALSSLKTLDLSYNTLWYEGAQHLRPLLASLSGLENLLLESCFPELVAPFNSMSSLGGRTAVEESVRLALMDVSNRLQCLNFGSNCITSDSRWLNALFAPGSTTQKLYLRGITSSSRCTIETEEANWRTSDTWDLQQVEMLQWSSSSVHTNKLLDALSAELQVAPEMRKMTLAFAIACEVQATPTFGSCFSQMQSVHEIALELHATVTSEAAAMALAHQLKTSWLKLSVSTDLVHDVKRDDDLAKHGKAIRSFGLLEQVKANKRIYRCRFCVTSASQR
ncbi:unnamed protein product [Hyaloperonospora brassicae]|uniref:PH domain-containing protein n=1 Tax=Hyaloperonospora brassicae TaxID=162125 RepID=A0AAV0V2M0_HYABA|nr:unnamed protein product [Hyaloperonospora brassicae]